MKGRSGVIRLRCARWHNVALAVLCALSAPGAQAAENAATAERLVLPSGLGAYLQEVIGEDGPLLRFRFVAPELARAAPLAQVSTDLEYLCNSYAAPRAPETGAKGVRIIVSLGDVASESGVFDPAVTQVFEAYRLENGACIWEAF